MSQQQPPPPPYQPSGGPPPYAGPPTKPRPRGLWFLVGGVLLVMAPLVFVGALFSVLRPLTQEDAEFEVSESPVTVELPAGEERALFFDDLSDASC